MKLIHRFSKHTYFFKSFIQYLQYVEAVVSSFMRAIKLEGAIEFQSWESKGFRIVKECIQKLAESLASEAVQQGSQKVTRSDAVRWLSQTPTFAKMLEYVFLHLYNYRPTTKTPQEETVTIRRKSIISEINKLLPYCEGLQYVPDYPAFTDISQMLFINSNLPNDYRSKWRFLFSSQIHGESFSTLMGRIVDQGPSVIIIEDTNGAVFGGFAPNSWTYGPKFCGRLFKKKHLNNAVLKTTLNILVYLFRQ